MTAGNFADLVERHFYDGMEIQIGKSGSVILILLNFQSNINRAAFYYIIQLQGVCYECI